MEKKQYVLVHVVSCFPNNSDQVLLVMKDRPEWQKGFFNLVGGKVEEGEIIEEAAIRELWEETGYTPGKWSNIDRMGIIEADGELVYCIRIEVDDYNQPNPIPIAGETEVSHWYSWRQVVNDKRLIPSLRIVLPFMLTGIYDWKMVVHDSLMGKVDNTVSVTIPSHLHVRFKENDHVTDILDGCK